MHGIPMVATSPVRHESPVGMNPVEIHSYEPPWKALTDFALHTDLDRLNNAGGPQQFQHLVNQVNKPNQNQSTVHALASCWPSASVYPLDSSDLLAQQADD